MTTQSRSVPSPGRASGREIHPEARRRIEAEHEHLKTLVSRLEGVEGLDEARTTLQELRDALVEHFATEEADDGLHQAIGTTAPEKDRAIEGLFDEHREFLIRLSRIQRKAEACHEALETLFEDGRRLAADLREHEAKETELFLDAVYTEHGGGD